MVVAVTPGAALETVLPAPVGVPLKVLVVAAPQHQRGVRGQPDDVLAGLGRDLVVQRLLFGIRGAGEGKVLPDQQAFLVGEFVEVVTLVQAAAPDPYEVDSGLGGLVEAGGDALAGEAGGEAVVGDPVDAAYEDRFAVDGDTEGLALQLDAPESGPGAPFLLAQAHGDLVQRLLAVAAGPPQFGVRDRQADLAARAALGNVEPGPFACDLHLGRQLAGAAEPVDIERHRQARHAVGARVSEQAYLGDAVPAVRLQGDGPPDS